MLKRKKNIPITYAEELIVKGIDPRVLPIESALSVLYKAPPDATAAEVLTMVQRALGHSSISSTTVYTSAPKEKVDNWLDAVKFE